MRITDGQNNDIKNIFPNYNRNKSSITFEAGNCNNKTFSGTFLVQIYRKGIYKFIDGTVIKKIK